jgi:hypothetical protein
MIQKSIYRTHRCEINSVQPLFHTFNRGTHCHAGKFTIAQLLAIVLESKPRSSSSTAPHVVYSGGPYDSRLRARLGSGRLACGVVVPSLTIRKLTIQGADAQPRTPVALQDSTFQTVTHLRRGDLVRRGHAQQPSRCTFQLAARTEWCQPQRHGCARRQFWNEYR